MRSTGQVIVLSGALLVASAFSGVVAAQGYGPQWRPAANFSLAQSSSAMQRTVSSVPRIKSTGVQRIANVPSFRPRSVRLAQRYAELKRSPRYDAQPAVAMHTAPIQQYQRYSHYQPYAAPTPTMYAPAYASPMWPGPFGQMVQALPNPMPMFSRQFAWRQPAEQWSSHPSAPPAYGQRALPQHPVTTYRDFGATSAANYRTAYPAGWRPVAQTRMQPPTRWTRSAYPAQLHARAAMPQQREVVAGGWRPHNTGSLASLSRHVTSFRPADYGRSTQVAQTLPANPQIESLPGWVTTFNDSDVSCSWCSGS